MEDEMKVMLALLGFVEDIDGPHILSTCWKARWYKPDGSMLVGVSDKANDHYPENTIIVVGKGNKNPYMTTTNESAMEYIRNA